MRVWIRVRVVMVVMMMAVVVTVRSMAVAGILVMLVVEVPLVLWFIVSMVIVERCVVACCRRGLASIASSVTVSHVA